MARAKAKDLRLKTEKELAEQLSNLQKEQFNLRFQRATNQQKNTARINAVRKEIAQISTIMNERKRKAA